VSVDLVCLGNLIVDDVVFSDGRTRRSEPGGALLYASLGARLWGASVSIVAPVGEDYPAATLRALADRGVDVSRLRPLGRPGLRAELIYEASGRRVLHRRGSPSHEDASPRLDDVAGIEARWFHLAPVPLELQAQLVAALADREHAGISLDPHEPIDEPLATRWKELLAGVDLLLVSEEEVALTDPAADAIAALRRLATGRLRGIALKRGARGGTYLDPSSGAVIEWPARFRAFVDPTGAGDAFAGGLLAGRLAGDSIERSIARGVVSASFALESWGAAGLLSASLEEAERRLAEWFGARLC
jgi:ribokinase